MPLLYGNPAQGGYGGIRPRIGNQSNRWQEQIRNNPKWGAWRGASATPEQETPVSPKLGAPAERMAADQPQGGGGGFQSFRSEPIPMAVAGIPGATQEMNQGVLRFLPEQIRKMMGV